MAILKRAKGAAVLAWHAARPKLTVRVAGTTLDVSTDSADARGLIYWSESWKSQLISSFLQSRTGLFIDVGANIGQTLLDYLAARSKGGYLGFEPSVAAANHISNVIHLNKLEDCQIVPAALSDRAGLVSLFSDHPLSPGATLMEGLRPEDGFLPSVVASVPFDDINDRKVAFAKIDVEGAELLVLRGMRRTLQEQRIPILCEVLRRDRHAEPESYRKRISELWGFVSGLGYSVWRVDKSPDLVKVEGFSRVSAFPDELYTPDNREMNDYILNPDMSEPSV